ncbi:hypothetical protein GCM10007879_30360 [Maritalea porphyrae]|uniref:Uncharacterized protein n=1 Tax=Maritalea porphyrae TaxID=880732 RepID=A0ABQ5UXS5_9HYPH|nr:hypothetical protein GCM10007879_30360 [Maritalea porphyrae]
MAKPRVAEMAILSGPNFLTSLELISEAIAKLDAVNAIMSG